MNYRRFDGFFVTLTVRLFFIFHFGDIKGDSETLAGLILEFLGEMPEKNDKISILNFEFIIKAVDNRRIKQIEVKTAEEDSK